MVKETGTAREIAASAYIGEIPDINGSLNIKLAKNMFFQASAFGSLGISRYFLNQDDYMLVKWMPVHFFNPLAARFAESRGM